jgi:hypothetical protein
MTILVLGSELDVHAAHLYAELARSQSVKYWDTSKFPSQMQLCWSPTTLEGAITFTDGDRIPLNQIKSVYWRTFDGIELPEIKDKSTHWIAYNDSISV